MRAVLYARTEQCPPPTARVLKRRRPAQHKQATLTSQPSTAEVPIPRRPKTVIGWCRIAQAIVSQLNKFLAFLATSSERVCGAALALGAVVMALRVDNWKGGEVAQVCAFA